MGKTLKEWSWNGNDIVLLSYDNWYVINAIIIYANKAFIVDCLLVVPAIIFLLWMIYWTLIISVMILSLVIIIYITIIVVLVLRLFSSLFNNPVVSILIIGGVRSFNEFCYKRPCCHCRYEYDTHIPKTEIVDMITRIVAIMIMTSIMTLTIW